MNCFSRAVVCLAVLTAPAAALGTPPANILKVPGDSDTIQGAVDLAGPDTLILVSKDIHVEIVSIMNKTNLTLIGKGKPAIDVGLPTAAITIGNCDGVVIQGFTVQDAGVGVEIFGSTNVSVKKCLIRDMTEQGIRASDSSFVVVERNTLMDIDGDGLDIGDVPGVTDCSVLKNKLKDIGNHGILVGGDRNLVEKNVVSGTGGHGLETRSLVSSNDNTFRSNRAKDAGNTGMLANGTGNLFEKNRVVMTVDDGMRISAGSTGNTFLGNRISKAGDEGIRVEGDGNTIGDCKVSGAGDEGIEIVGNANLVEDSKSSKSADGGMLCEGSNNTFRGCKASGSLGNGFDVRATGNTFEECKASKSAEDGFLVEGTGHTFTGNKATGSGDLDLEDLNGVVGPNTYVDNTFPDNNLGL